MTTNELIEMLKQYPPDTPVYVHQWLFDEDSDQYPADVPVLTLKKELGKEFVSIHSEFC